MTTVTPLSNHFFFLASQALPPALPQHDQNQPYVLRVEGDGAQPGARVVPRPKALNSQGSAETRSQQWSMTAEGRIVSRLSGCAMAWDDDDGVLVAAPVGDPARPHQFWSVAGDGRLASRTLSGHVLTVSGEANPVLAELDGESVSDPVRAHYWTLLAAPLQSGDATVPTWVYFQSALQDDAGQNCVLNVEGYSHSPWAPVIFWPLTQTSTHAANELWQITPDGRILSGLGDNLALTLGVNGGVTVQLQQYPLPLSQVWDLSTPNQICSALTGEFLCPSGGAAAPYDGTPIVAASGAPSSSYTWYTVPPSPLPLQQIVGRDPEPFPEFTGDQAEAYSVILDRLGLVSLRAQYYNLQAPLDVYNTDIVSWTDAPDGIPQDAWDAVRLQLETEIECAITARNVFTNYTNFQNTLFGTDGATVAKLIDDAGIMEGDQDPNVGGIILAIVEGLLYTALCALPGVGEAAISVGGIVGNLMMTAVNAALADSGPHSISPDPFQVAASDLWGELRNNYQAVLGAMGSMETEILKDWGMLQTLYPLAIKQGGPDSLFWDPSTTPDLVAAATPGYEVSVMQMLMPAKYSIFLSFKNNRPDDVPSWAKWDSGTYQAWIAESTNHEMYPSEQAMQTDIWDNGVQQADFFRCAAGWGFTVVDPDVASAVSCLTFTNLTQNMLWLDCLDGSSDVAYLQNQYIPPYQSSWVLMEMGSYMFGTQDLNAVEGDDAAFTVGVLPMLRDIQISGMTAATGFQFTAPVANGNGALQVSYVQTPNAQSS
ncbi:hypothetical protein [Streptomyces sp. NPDC056431]|uniref:hypothetical protein n=1 Tax=Streptomyces sp. NPDC056431 TaxID=3345814 RepID=UPI0036AC420D